MQRVFQGIYESVEFAKLKLLARALERAQVYDGGRLVVSYLLRSDFHELGVGEEYAEGIIDYLRAVDGAEMAAHDSRAARASGCRAADQPARRRATSSTCPRSPGSAVAADIVRRPASPARSRSRRSSEFIRTAFGEAHACRELLDRSGLVLVDKPAGPSSFAVVKRLRDRTGARAGHAGTLDPFATGLLLVLLGSSTRLAQYLVGLDKRYVTEIDLRTRTSTGDPEGEVVEQARAAEQASSSRHG